MALDYAIRTDFFLADRASAALSAIGVQGQAMNHALARGLAAGEQRVHAMGAAAVTAGKAFVGIGIGAVAAGLGVVAGQFVDFDAALHSAGAAFSDVDTRSADFEDRLGVIGQAVRDVAAATEFDATQSANAMATLARAGVESASAVALLPGVADLATAAAVSMDEAAGMAVGGLNTMGMMSDVPEVLAANMARLSDVMAYTADSANMSLQDVGSAITQGGNFFKTANNDLTVFSGSLTALANASITGAEAGVALRNIMTNLSAPTSSAAKALAAMNIATQDSAGNLLPLPEIIGQFERAMAGVGDAEKNASLYAIFGKQNIASFTALLNTGQAGLEQYAAAADNSFGSAAAKAEAMRASIQNKFSVLQSALTELGFKFAGAFSGQAGTAIERLTDAVNRFDPAPLIGALSAALNAVTTVVPMLWHMRGAVVAVVAGVTAFRTVMTVAAAAIMAWRAVTGIATAAQLAYAIVIKGSAAAQSALVFQTNAVRIATLLFSGALKVVNALFFASPIGWIALALAGLTVLVVQAIKHWDSWGQAVAGALTLAVPPLGMFISMVHSLYDNWAGIKAAFADGGLAAGIAALGSAIKDGIFAPLDAVAEKVREIPVLGAAVAGLAGMIKAPFEFIAGIPAAIGMIGAAWTDMVAVFRNQGLAAVLRSFFDSFVSFVLAPVEAALRSLTWVPVVGSDLEDWANRIGDIRNGSLLNSAGSGRTGSAGGTSAPVSAAERAASSYSREESSSTSNVNISLADGLQADVSGSVARGVSIDRGKR